MSKTLPAYASDLADARHRGFTLKDPTVSIRMSWGPRPCVGYGVVIPSDRTPSDLDWSWLRGLEVILHWWDESEDRMSAAVDAIRVAKPRRLVVVDFRDGKLVNILRSEVPRAAA